MPMPCSIESTPAATAAADPSAFWVCTATRPPAACTAFTTALRSSVGIAGSPGIQSAMSLAQPVRPACSAATAGRSSGAGRRPGLEELVRLGEPRSGVDRPGPVRVAAEPVRRLTRQPRRPDQGHPGRDVRAQVLAEQRLVERVARHRRPGVRMRVDQTRKDPPLRDQGGPGHRVGGPAVTVGVEVDRLPVGQRVAADPGDHAARS